MCCNVSKLLLLALVVSIFTVQSEANETVNIPSPCATESNCGCYKISKSYQLTKAIHGIDGELQLLQDSRLTKDVYDKRFGTAFSTMYINDENILSKYKNCPPFGTVLRILSRHEDYVLLNESYYMEAPVAMLDEVKLSDGVKPTYLFTLDESMGFGSYNGPITYFYEVIDGKLKSLEYADNTTKKKEPIVLMRSLKTGWKFFDPKSGKSKDILHIACHPDFKGTEKNKNEEDDFVISYDRFQFNGKEWVKYTKGEKGFWEDESANDEDFPPLSKFPMGQ